MKTPLLKDITRHLSPFITDVSWQTSPEIAITAIQSPDLAKDSDLVFVINRKHLDTAFQSPAKVFCLNSELKNDGLQFLSKNPDRYIFYSNEPELAMREAIQEFFLKTPYINKEESELIHPTAVVHPAAVIGEGTRIGPYAVISSGVKLGKGVVVSSHVVVETNAVIEDNSVLHPFVYIGHDCLIGKSCEIHPHTVIGKEGFGYVHDKKGNHFRIPHQGRVVLEDNVQLGSTVTIDRGTFGETRIGKGSIFDNRIHLAHNVSIGEGAVITSGLTVAGSTKIGKYFLTGGNSSITGHVEICDGVQLAGVSVVRKSILKPGSYGGNPLVPLQEYIKTSVAISRLPQLLKLFRSSTPGTKGSGTKIPREE